MQVIHEGKELCMIHYNLIPEDEPKPKPKKEVNNAYILL